MTNRFDIPIHQEKLALPLNESAIRSRQSGRVLVSCREGVFQLLGLAHAEMLTATTDWSAFSRTGLPACLVCDLGFFDEEVGRAIDQMQTHGVNLPIVGVVSYPVQVDTVLSFLTVGMCGIFRLPEQNAAFHKAVESAISHDSQKAMLRRGMDSWTKRERQIVGLLLQGMTSKAVANRLGIAFQTVDKHKQKSLQKVKLRSLTELASLLDSRALGQLSVAEENEKHSPNRGLERTSTVRHFNKTGAPIVSSGDRAGETRQEEQRIG